MEQMSQSVPLEQNSRMCRLRTHDAHVIRLSTDQSVDPVDITMETASALLEGKRATSVDRRITFNQSAAQPTQR